ncbi:MAG: LysR family transcriptional regulator [Roseburia sp.]|jgi:DNA-binding transcriptional LysR family regulator|nr:LysR family transcriptional regulator [Roseburia sp.]
MTLKHIRIFVTVYQEESITRAAEKLHMTQPATSLAIREMEEYYHTKLFERSGRGIRVTSAGTRLYPSAARLLSLYDEMDAEMKNWDTSGKLRIGSSISIGSCILPQLINRFSKKYPELELYVKVDSSDVIEQNILENHLDFALIEGSVHSEKLNSSVFLDDELVPVCSRFHPLAGAEDIELDSLKKEHFLMREPNSGTRQLADSSFALKNFQIKPTWESTSTAALINAVSIGLGISILPKRMLEKQLRMHQIASFTIHDLDLKRHYSLIYHENKFVSPTMQEFFDMLEDIKG